jgi:hypothetical protein
VAVGANGETLVADSSTSTGLRYTAGTVQANPVLNSAAAIWQRGTSVAFNGSVGYFADRFYAFCIPAGTFSRQLTNDTTNLPFIQYCMRIQRNAGNAVANNIRISQSLETVNSVPFAGKTVTFSFYARKGADYSSASSSLAISLGTGTGTDQNYDAGYTGVSYPISATPTLTTTWQRFTYTGTIPTNATEIGFNFSHNTVGTAGAADYYELTGIQIDIGSVALPFRTYAGTIQGELAACQRYYFRWNAFSNPTMLSTTALSYSTTALLGYCNFPVTMRTTPTALDTSAMSTFAWDRGTVGNGSTPSSISFDATTNANIGSYQINTTGLTANSIYRVYSNAANAYVGFASEL